MDLSEIRPDTIARHPWELARARAILRILRPLQGKVRTILDYGCGDGFTGKLVQETLGAPYLVGVDIHFSEGMVGRGTENGFVRERARDEDDLGDRRFDLILACDVIEHVADDRGLVRRLVERHARPGGHLLVTVPAFQVLFSRHDRALRHHRRYTLRALQSVVRSAGLVSVHGGFLFSTLLLPRALGKLAEGLQPKGDDMTDNDSFGAGGWNVGRFGTWLVSSIFALDNQVLLAAARARIILPGLTAWVLCKTSS